MFEAVVASLGSLSLGIVFGWLVRFFIWRFDRFGPQSLASVIGVLSGGAMGALATHFLKTDPAIWWFYPIGLLFGFALYHFLTLRHMESMPLAPQERRRQVRQEPPTPPKDPGGPLDQQITKDVVRSKSSKMRNFPTPRTPLFTDNLDEKSILQIQQGVSLSISPVPDGAYAIETRVGDRLIESLEEISPEVLSILRDRVHTLYSFSEAPGVNGTGADDKEEVLRPRKLELLLTFGKAGDLSFRYFLDGEPIDFAPSLRLFPGMLFNLNATLSAGGTGINEGGKV